MFGQLTWKDEADRGLDLTRLKRLLFRVLGGVVDKVAKNTPKSSNDSPA